MMRIIINQDKYTDNIPFSESWERYDNNTGGSYAQGNILLKKIADDPKWRIGAGIYHFIKTGKVVSFDSLEILDHYIKLPIAWLSEIHHTEDVLDEEGNKIGTEPITNDVYYQVPKRKNDTHVLVKVTSENFNDLTALINYITYEGHTNIAENMVCNDKFYKAINPPYEEDGEMVGGEFYIVPEEEENN